jgi:hypothetical protein
MSKPRFKVGDTVWECRRSTGKCMLFRVLDTISHPIDFAEISTTLANTYPRRFYATEQEAIEAVTPIPTTTIPTADYDRLVRESRERAALLGVLVAASLGQERWFALLPDTPSFELIVQDCNTREQAEAMVITHALDALAEKEGVNP